MIRFCVGIGYLFELGSGPPGRLVQLCDSGSLGSFTIFLEKLFDPFKRVSAEDKTIAMESLHALNHQLNVRFGCGRR